MVRKARIHWMIVAAGVATLAGDMIMPQVLSKPTTGDGFAAGRTNEAVPFNANRAVEYVHKICQLGPRLSGTEAMAKQQELVEQHFTKLGAKVTRQKFEAKQVSQHKPVSMTNLIITWHPERERRILLCSHYDTRPLADNEHDPNKWRQTFHSANDGTSGVAWLMELGHHVKAMNLNVGVDFVIFDGEEYIFDNRPGVDQYFFGSKHFAREYQSSRPKHRYIAGILVDLFAAKDARFPIEVNSQMQAGAIVEQVWQIAAELNEPMFVKRLGTEVQDDHLALNAANIPTIDIIDMDYPHWHKLSDTPDKVSGDTMARVSRVVTTWLSRIR